MLDIFDPKRCAALVPVGALPRGASQCRGRPKEGSLLCGTHQLAARRRQRSPVLLVPGAPVAWELNVQNYPDDQCICTDFCEGVIPCLVCWPKDDSPRAGGLLNPEVCLAGKQ